MYWSTVAYEKLTIVTATTVLDPCLLDATDRNL